MEMDLENVQFNLSTSPHVRCKESTASIMYDVVIALLPATVVGIVHFWRYGGTAVGIHALLVVLISVAAAMVSELAFTSITKRPVSLWDGSAVITGLLLALSLPATVPLYVPLLGSIFAIIFVKCLFGSLGQNFMNPALAGRAFVSISFTSAVSSFAIDGVSSATPLAILNDGGTVNGMRILLGLDNGVIGLSGIALLIGGIYLLARKVISWEIPVTFIGCFTVMMAIFGEGHLDPLYLMVQVCSGGVLMGALFMATDMVTSPISPLGHLIYGAGLGILAAVFRLFGSAADSVSFAIIIGNLFVPLIDMFVVPVPHCYKRTERREIPKEAIILCVITLVAGIALSGVNAVTKGKIAEQEALKEAQSYLTVCPDAVSINTDEVLTAAVESEGEGYGSGSFGSVTINKAMDALDAEGNVVGYALSVTSGDAFDGTLTVSVGIGTDGTVTGIAFTELNETAGMGMRADEPEFKDQFVGANVDSFILNKAGGSTADNEIDSISGASRTSGAVVNAVNAAIDFLNTHKG